MEGVGLLIGSRGSFRLRHHNANVVYGNKSLPIMPVGFSLRKGSVVSHRHPCSSYVLTSRRQGRPSLGPTGTLTTTTMIGLHAEFFHRTVPKGLSIQKVPSPIPPNAPPPSMARCAPVWNGVPNMVGFSPVPRLIPHLTPVARTMRLIVPN